ncbi:MAG: hypothetical protein ICV51_09660 [Flavisolibacter sp.]|nr:hypothetical protein [Flavisolibacter sp.]
MDLINNLVFTALNTVDVFGPISPDFIPLRLPLLGPPVPVNRGNFFSYDITVIQEFCAVDDSRFIDNAIQKHWADIVLGRSYSSAGQVVSSFRSNVAPNNLIPPYHLIYAYLVENTRIAQIFERLLFLYLHDEKLSKATTTSLENRLAFQWIINTESLFYKDLPNNIYRNITSQIRTSQDATRRNAYFRMFGMDLAFGDSLNNAPVNYHKAESNNQPFILLFERFLIEVWQAYTNARNQVGPNTTDMFSIVDTAQKIQEMLMARRTTETDFNNYRYFNLSKEEYASVVMMSWLYEVVSYDSPLIQFLRCNGGTPGERLINIGNKVGIPAHSKSEGLLDIAPPMNTLLRRIELGDYNQPNEAQVRRIIESQTPGSPATADERAALEDLLLIINNWEKATGHRIKNPETKLTGNIRVTQPLPTNGRPVPATS